MDLDSAYRHNNLSQHHNTPSVEASCVKERTVRLTPDEEKGLNLHLKACRHGGTGRKWLEKKLRRGNGKLQFKHKKVNLGQRAYEIDAPPADFFCALLSDTLLSRARATVILSHPVLSCALLLVALALIRRFIRESYSVDGLTQKHVLITGCDSGFGNLLARQLDRRGVQVIAACLTEKGAADLAAATSPRLKTLLLDVTDSGSIGKAVEFVSGEVGERGLWGLVNNAGISIPIGPTEWMKMEDFTKVLDVNLIGVIDVTLQFLPLVKKARGRVVNVASIFGRLSLTGGGYCLSKYGVEAFSDSLRRDMRPFGVTVSMIEPGFFKTGLTQLDPLEADLKRMWSRLPQDVKDSYGATYFDDYIKAQAFSMGILCSSDLSKVTRCMQHALTAQFPRIRYSAGWDAKFLWIPLSYMPSFVSDSFVNALLPSPKDERKIK